MASKATQQRDYSLGIRGAVRALWKGLIDADQFYDWMQATIRRRLTMAWYAGAAECGIQPTELSPVERNALGAVIQEELNHTPGFAASILSYSQARGGKLAQHLGRAEMWTLRWQDVHTRARLMACGDKKLKWTLGPTKEHCISCDVKLNGKVKRASYWASVGIQPQSPPNPYLECKGFRCLCALIETTERCSPGPLPRLP